MTKSSPRFRRAGEPLRGLRLVILLQWILAVAGFSVLASLVERRGGDVAREVLAPVLVIVAALTVLFFVLSSTYLPGRIRAAIIRRRVAEATVFSVYVNDALASALNQSGLHSKLSPKRHLTLTVSADTGGLKIWAGLRPAHSIAETAWSEVYELGGALSGESISPSAAIRVVLKSGGPPIELSLIPMNWFQLGALSAKKLQPVIEQLRELHAAAKG